MPTRTSLTGSAPYTVVQSSNVKAKIVTPSGDEFFYTSSLSGVMNNSANDGDTVVLLADSASSGVSVNNNKAITLDLNGYSVKRTDEKIEKAVNICSDCSKHRCIELSS